MFPFVPKLVAEMCAWVAADAFLRVFEYCELRSPAKLTAGFQKALAISRALLLG